MQLSPKCDQEYVEELEKGFIPLVSSSISGFEDVAGLESEKSKNTSAVDTRGDR